MGRSNRPTTSNLFKEYNGNITSRTAKASRSADLDERNKDPYCCCCYSTSVLIFTNTVTFVLSLGLIIVGAFINNEVSGWELKTFDIIGNLVLGLGFIIAAVSVVGVFAGRTNSRTLLFVYFMSILLVSYLLLLAVVWALLEGDAMGELLDQNWEQVQKVVGTDASRDDVVELMQDYMYATSGVGGAGLLMLVTALVSTVRLLGLRAIAYSCLLSLAMLGGGCVYSGIASRGEVPTATTALLFGCGGVQVIVAICGLSAFKSLNRECARWFFIVLIAACGGLVYVVVSSYQYLRDHSMEHPENLMLAPASLLTRQRGAFAAADKSAEGTIHFSNNDKKFGKKGRGRNGKGRTREIQLTNVRNAL